MFFEDGRLRIVFDFPARTACFDRSGRCLALVAKDGIALVDLEPEPVLRGGVTLT